MLESLLRAFGKASSRNAFPSSQKISVPVKGQTWWESFTAPDDGYFVVYAYGTKTAIEVSGRCGSTTFKTYNGTSRVSIPISKGEGVVYYVEGTSTPQGEAYFVSAKLAL